MPDSKHSDSLRQRKPVVESRHKILPVESDHADAARYATSSRFNYRYAMSPKGKRLEFRLSYLAQYDVLAELPNRSQFRDRLSGAMARAARP